MAFPHWEYFLTLDDDLERLARYIEFTHDNFATYSVELVRVILAAGSEIDVVAKSLCRNLNPVGSFENIDQYRQEMMRKYPGFPTLKITLPRYGLVFEPWADWASAANPAWWRSHTDIKHHRDSHYAQANLGNTLNAVSGLFALLLYYYQPDLYKHQLLPWPKLLHLTQAHYKDFRIVGIYELPDFGSSKGKSSTP
jgi:hypothetical protein